MDIYDFTVRYFDINEYKDILIENVVNYTTDKVNAETTFEFIEELESCDIGSYLVTKYNKIKLPYAQIIQSRALAYTLNTDDNKITMDEKITVNYCKSLTSNRFARKFSRSFQKGRVNE
ncbi:MAG: hypothetical protein ACRC6E_08295 [Fusobacteriaceae bacterium]